MAQSVNSLINVVETENINKKFGLILFVLIGIEINEYTRSGNWN